MLGKLLKFELHAMGRILLPIYGVCILMGILLTVSLQDSVQEALDHEGGLMIMMATVFSIACLLVFVMTIVMLITRFSRNMVGREGYLMHTLPVSIPTHLWSKLLASLIFVILGGITGILSLTPTLISIDFSEFWHGLVHILTTTDAFVEFLRMVVIVLLAASTFILKVYASLSIGYSVNSHRMLLSVGTYFVFSIIESLVGNVLDSLFPNPDNSFTMALLLYSGNAGDDLSSFLSLAAILLAGDAIYFVITWQVLKRKLNLL